MQQPVVLTCLCNVVLVGEAKGEVESWTEDIATSLSEGFAYGGHESRLDSREDPS